MNQGLFPGTQWQRFKHNGLGIFLSFTKYKDNISPDNDLKKEGNIHTTNKLALVCKTPRIVDLTDALPNYHFRASMKYHPGCHTEISKGRLKGKFLARAAP